MPAFNCVQAKLLMVNKHNNECSYLKGFLVAVYKKSNLLLLKCMCTNIHLDILVLYFLPVLNLVSPTA